MMQNGRPQLQCWKGVMVFYFTLQIIQAHTGVMALKDEMGLNELNAKLPLLTTYIDNAKHKYYPR